MSQYTWFIFHLNFLRTIVLYRGERISGTIMYFVNLTGSIWLWNYIHRENVGSHIHIVHPIYKYSFTTLLPNIYLTLLEVARETTWATLELQSISNGTSKHLQLLQTWKLTTFYVLFSEKLLPWQDIIELTRAQLKSPAQLPSATFVQGCMDWLVLLEGTEMNVHRPHRDEKKVFTEKKEAYNFFSTLT